MIRPPQQSGTAKFDRDRQADICRYLPVSAGICRYLPLSAVICRYLPISADICRYLPISADICWYGFWRISWEVQYRVCLFLLRECNRTILNSRRLLNFYSFSKSGDIRAHPVGKCREMSGNVRKSRELSGKVIDFSIMVNLAILRPFSEGSPNRKSLEMLWNVGDASGGRP